jgi:hypothetical protein
MANEWPAVNKTKQRKHKMKEAIHQANIKTGRHFGVHYNGISYTIYEVIGNNEYPKFRSKDESEIIKFIQNL